MFKAEQFGRKQTGDFYLKEGQPGLLNWAIKKFLLGSEPLVLFCISDFSLLIASRWKKPRRYFSLLMSKSHQRKP